MRVFSNSLSDFSNSFSPPKKHQQKDIRQKTKAKMSKASANPLTLIGDFTHPLGIAATVVVIALVLGCAGQLFQLAKPSSSTKKVGAAATRTSARAKKLTPKAKAAASVAAPTKRTSSARKVTPKRAPAKKSTAAASLMSPTRTSTRTRTPTKKYLA